MNQSTYNPILHEEEYKNGLFPNVPIPGHGQAILLVARTLNYRTLLIDKSVKPSIIRKGKYDYLVEIDMHPRNIGINMEAMSSDHVSKFKIYIAATAVVVDPDLVYREKINDVAHYIKNGIESEIRGIAHKYKLSQFEFFKQDIENCLSAHGYIDGGLNISNIHVNVEGDEAFINKQQKIREIVDKAEIDQSIIIATEAAKEKFADRDTAIYSEYVTGNISALEAYEKKKKGEANDFDENIRRGKELFNLGKEFSQESWVNDRVMSKIAEETLNSVAPVNSNTKLLQSSNQDVKQITKEEDDIFDSFDED